MKLHLQFFVYYQFSLLVSSLLLYSQILKANKQQFPYLFQKIKHKEILSPCPNTTTASELAANAAKASWKLQKAQHVVSSVICQTESESTALNSPSSELHHVINRCLAMNSFTRQSDRTAQQGCPWCISTDIVTLGMNSTKTQQEERVLCLNTHRSWLTCKIIYCWTKEM